MGTLSNLEFQLLAVLGAKEQSGRDVALAYHGETGQELSYGSLYTTLRRLKESGFVDTRESEDEDGRIRYFKINGHGRAALAARRRELHSLATFGQKKALA
jgi:DNA-binding PadR family transcriptional regulator